MRGAGRKFRTHFLGSRRQVSISVPEMSSEKAWGPVGLDPQHFKILL